MPKSIVVVGAGIVGLCIAYYAQQKGHTVTLLERGAPDHDNCSQGNAGMVVPSHFVPLAAPGMPLLGLKMLRRRDSPFALHPRLNADLLEWSWRFLRACTPRHVRRSAPLLRDLNMASRAEYVRLAEQTGNPFKLTQKGLLMLCKTEAALHEESAMLAMAQRLGVPAEKLTPEQAGRLDPTIRMDIAGAIYFPDDCHLTPMRLTECLTRLIQEKGGSIHWNCPVKEIHAAGRRVEAIAAGGKRFEGDEYVIAAGSWSSHLLKPLKLHLPLQPGKGYSMTLQRPIRLPTICSILVEARVAMTPMDGALRVGGTMEIGVNDRQIDRRRVDGIVSSFPDYYPEFSASDFRDISVWSGLRPCAPDGLPYIGRFERYANVSVATGHAMMGISLGPITGKLMADVLSDEPPSIGIGPLRPDRFN